MHTFRVNHRLCVRMKDNFTPFYHGKRIICRWSCYKHCFMYLPRLVPQPISFPLPENHLKPTLKARVKLITETQCHKLNRSKVSLQRVTVNIIELDNANTAAELIGRALNGEKRQKTESGSLKLN